MSRCFPYQHPGFEKKARIDDSYLLTKEKKKEKKDKKKKEKEQREGKEKKGEEISKEKHRDKKDRKEKQRSKKDKNKGKENNRTSTDKRVDGDELGPNRQKDDEIKDSKYVQDLARRIIDEEKISVTDQREGELSGRVEKRNIDSKTKEKDKTAQKKDGKKLNGFRDHVDARRFEKEVVECSYELEKIPMAKKNGEEQMEGKDKRKQGDSHERNARETKKIVGKQMEGNEKSQYGIDARGLENEVVHDFSRMEKKRVEQNAKNKSNGEKCKDSDQEKKIKGSRKDSMDTCITEPSQLIKETNAGDVYLGKRKKPDKNGYLHDNGIQPNKLPRLVSSSPLATENGRKLEPCQTAISMDSGIRVNDPKLTIKEHRINGLSEAQQHSISSTRNDEKPEKCLHPDSKFLSEILSVPTMQEWSDFDEQEWLFSSDCHRLKKPKVGSPDSCVTQQVWAEALYIDDAGVCVLPYVIPY